jgi:hypothetical protein
MYPPAQKAHGPAPPGVTLVAEHRRLATYNAVNATPLPSAANSMTGAGGRRREHDGATPATLLLQPRCNLGKRQRVRMEKWCAPPLSSQQYQLPLAAAWFYDV